MKTTFLAVLLIAPAAFAPKAFGQESDSAVEAFIEPFKTIGVPASEVGTLVSIDVEEGQHVEAGSILARMDDRILLASLAAARAAKDSTGNLKAAQAELNLKQRQIESLEELRSRGNATQRELERAEADRELCEAKLQAVREELQIRVFEHERIAAQIEKRILRSPIDGVVESIAKQEGEFVSPTDPIVLTIVQLDPVQVVFSLPIHVARKIRRGREVMLTVGAEDQPIKGLIEFISPTAEAQSGTMRVKVRIANPNGKVLSGSTCRWETDAIVAESIATAPTRKLLIAK